MGFYLRKMNIGGSETCLVVKKNTSKYIKIITVNHVSDVMFSIEIYNGEGYINCRKITALKNDAGYGACYVKQDSNNIYVYTSWGGVPTGKNSYVFADSSAILSNGVLPSQTTDVEELT